MRNIRLRLEYEGTRYFGFEIQPGRPTIRAVVEKELSKLTQEDTKIIFSSRTDAGVHAFCQVVNFKTASLTKTEDLAGRLNENLPQDIRVKEAAEVEANFHARFQALWKEYIYWLHAGNFLPVYLKNYVYHLRAGLDIEKMQQAADCLVGEHDFSAFCLTQSRKENCVRKIFSLEIKQKENFVFFKITGNGFLHKMVRTLAGTLLEAGKGRIGFHKIKEILESRDIKFAGPTLPAQGLYLAAVGYKS